MWTSERPRVKRYAAQSGYVYEYYFAGNRGAEYMFAVSANRRKEFPISVILSPRALGAWMRSNRELNATERYGIAKMALFRAFDESPEPDQLRRTLRPSLEQISMISRDLDL